MSVLRAARVHRAPVAVAAVGLAMALIAGGCDWAQFRSNPQHTGAVAEIAIGPGNVAQLEQAWSVDLGAGSFPVAAPVTVGGNVVTEVNGIAKAVAQSDGSVRWTQSLGGTPGLFDSATHSPPSVVGPNVYFGELNGVTLPAGGGRGHIDVLDAATGTFQPSITVTLESLGVPTPITVTDGGELWFNSETFPGSGVSARGVTGMLNDGRVIFDQQTGSGPAGTPAVADGVVYSGDRSGHLGAYDGAGHQANCQVTSDGTFCSAIWTANTGDVAHGPAVDGGTVFAVAPDGTLSAVPVDGPLGAGHPISWQGAGVTTDPAVEGPWVFGGSAEGLRAFAAAGCGAATCDPAWTGNPGAAASTAPVIADGLVFVGTAGGHVAAFARDGCGAPAGGTCAPLWTAATPGTPTAVIVANGRVIVGTATGGLAAFAQRS